MNKRWIKLKCIVLIFIALCLCLFSLVAFGYWRTESAIEDYRTQILKVGQAHNPVQMIDLDELQALPEPVQNYFRFVFAEKNRQLPRSVVINTQGEFRRPLTTSFESTTAQQRLVTSEPALIFDATAQMPFGMWARAYDFYAQGQMAMQARVLSAVTVVNEVSTPALNQTSLQRWLLESSLNPAALLPGGVVRWEAINDHQARAIVSSRGMEASLVATFRADGSLETFVAEKDGDLSTPYHGAGEYVLRENYQLHNGIMIPMQFVVARSANGKTYPFWSGRVTRISFEY